MPLFMFLSGYLLQYTFTLKNRSLQSMTWNDCNLFIRKKIKRLIIPYFVIGSIAFLIKAFMNKFALRPVEISLFSYIQTFIYPWDNAIIFFWFLPTLFFIFCIIIYGGYGLTRIHTKYQYSYIIILLSLCLHLFNPVANIKLLNIGGIANYLIYFVAGYYFSCHELETKIIKNAFSITIISLLLSILLIIAPSFYGKDILTSFNGILMSFAFCQLYVKYKWHFFHPFFGASYAIYLFSWFPQVLSQQVFISLTHAPWPYATILAIVSGILIPLIIYKYITTHKRYKIVRYIAYLTGMS